MQALDIPSSCVDVAALEALLVELEPTHLAYLASRIPDDLRPFLGPEDVLQEVRVSALRGFKAAGVADRDSVVGWLMTLVKRRLFDQIRVARRKKNGGEGRRIPDAVTASRSGGRLLDRLARTTTTPSRRFATKEAKSAVRLAIARLPDHQRQVVWLRYYRGLRIKDIAEETGSTVGSVKMLLQRSQKAMRANLGSASRFFSQSGSSDPAG